MPIRTSKNNSPAHTGKLRCTAVDPDGCGCTLEKGHEGPHHRNNPGMFSSNRCPIKSYEGLQCVRNHGHRDEHSYAQGQPAQGQNNNQWRDP